MRNLLNLSTFFSALFLSVFTTAAANIEITGSDSQTVIIEDTSRVVSIGGSVTEILYAFGLEDKIVAVDTTSLYPPAALKTKPNVGYMRQLSAEGVLSLNPTLILAIDGAGPPDVINVLQKTSVPLVMIPDDPTPKGVSTKIRLISSAMNVSDKGDKLVRSIEEDFQKLADVTKQFEERKHLLFILSVRDGRIMASGAQTAADGIIKLAGAQNAISSFSGFKPLNDEAIITAAPDTILMMHRQGHDAEPGDIFSLPSIKATPAAEARALHQIDGAYMLGFGPRSALAARDLAKQLYPEADFPEFSSETLVRNN